MIVETDFRFNRSGQGCFYTGLISAYSREFSFVYDCGTKSIRNNLRSDIHDYKRHLHGNHLDLLIISHFDDDHVNEVGNLLDGISCDTIIIPYLLPEERIFLLAMYYYYLDRDNPDDPPDDDYITFVTDPISYLSSKRFKINRIILVIGGKGRGQDIPKDNDNPPESYKDNDRPVTHNLSNSEELQKLASEQDATGISNAKTKGIYIDYCTHDGYVQLAAIWYFKLFNLSQNTEKLTKFNSVLRKKLGIRRRQITTDDIANIFQKGFYGYIKNSYKNIFGDVNSTSLVLFHGPFFQKFALDIYSHYLEQHFPTFLWRRLHWSFLLNNSCGTLLTGDITLSGDYLNEIIEYFHTDINSIRFFQVPHHGSRLSWNVRILEYIQQAEFMIINSGLGNTFKHPSGQVIQNIYDNHRGKIILNNQINSFCSELILRYP